MNVEPGRCIQAVAVVAIGLVAAAAVAMFTAVVWWLYGQGPLR